jgi:site-specific recombinase XerD
MRQGSSGLDPLIEGYLDYLLEVGRKSPGTIRDMRCTFRQVCQVMERKHGDVPLWKLRLEDFIRWLGDQRELRRSSASLSKYLSHLRGLLDYAWRSGRSDRNVLDGFMLQDELRRMPPAVLSEEEAARLVRSCRCGTALERQERLIILVLYGCGLRTDELRRLDLEDVKRERRELLIRRGKGDRERVIPIPEGVFTELLAYLLERGGRRGALFRTAARRQRLSSHRICEVVRRASERAGLTKLVTPKTLRHSYATHLMDRGVDVAVISSLMGHRSPAETGVYLHVLGEKPREAVMRLRGRQRTEGGGQ